jgi:hypothetical protein
LPFPKVGTTGACKICRFTHEGELNAKYLADPKGFNAATAALLAKTKWGFSFTRQTWYAHVKYHLRAAEDRFVEKANTQLVRTQRGLIKDTTNDQFLQAVIDLGLQKALDTPESVTVEHALKAVSIREQRKERVNNLTLVLAQFITGQRPAYIVEGEAVEGIATEVPVG